MSFQIPRLFFIGSLFIVACGKKNNSDIPPSIDKLTKAVVTDEAFKKANDRWVKLAAQLQIPLNEAGSDPKALSAVLSTPSTLISDAAKNAENATKLGALQTANAYATRCSSIESISLLGEGKALYTPDNSTTPAELTTATVYLMKYKLQASKEGAAESQERSGVVVLPNAATGSAPIVAFGHGGDAGLSYAYGVAPVFGALQSTHIVVAPTFPGEQLCMEIPGSSLTKKCKDTSKIFADIQVGSKSEVYRTDADELLGMHDCVARATMLNTPYEIAVPASTVGTTFKTQLLTGVKRMGGTGTYKDFPKSYIVGASRGGNVMNMALAKSGAALSTIAGIKAKYPTDTSSANAAQAAALGSKYYFPSLFNCSVSLFSPATFTHVDYRVLLEILVKNLIDYTAVKVLPSGTQLIEYLQPYVKGEIDAAEMANRLMLIDAAFQAPLMMGALQNWATSEKGKMLMIHGEMDRVVNVGQSLFSSVLYNKTQAGLVALSKIPGVDLSAVTLKAADTDVKTDVIGGVSKTVFVDPTSTQHADPVFFRSTGNKDMLSTNQAEDSVYKGKTPGVLVGTWLAEKCN